MRGRSEGDERCPKDKDGNPKRGNPYQREFGVPPSKTQDSFTDPEARIMKRAGGGFDCSDNAQTAVDEAAHITVAAEVVNTSLDVQQLPTVLAAVKAHTESVIALGREGEEQARPTDAQRYPHTVAMQAKSQTNKGKADYRKRKRKRKRKWIVESPNGAATRVPKMFWCLTPSTTQRATLACSLTPRPMTPMQT